MDAEAFATGMLGFCFLQDFQTEKSIRWMVRSLNKRSALEIQNWGHLYTESI